MLAKVAKSAVDMKTTVNHTVKNINIIFNVYLLNRITALKHFN